MKITKIEWCDSSVNPTHFQCCGCELWNTDQDVRDCYAGQFAERIGGVGAFDKPVELAPGRMAEAASWSDLRGVTRTDKPWIPHEYPRLIFIGDMADTLQPGVPFEYLRDEVIANVISEQGRRHVWMWLTKQAGRLMQFAAWMQGQGIGWPENLWPGVSVTSQKTAWRIDHLMKVKARHCFISYEPAWGWVDFTPWLWEAYKDEEGLKGVDPSYAISMIITGGESGRNAHKHPFNVEWPRKLIEECEEARVACFVKQLGKCAVTDNANMFDWPDGAKLEGQRMGFAACRFITNHPKGGDWAEWPEELRVRQFPEVP